MPISQRENEMDSPSFSGSLAQRFLMESLRAVTKFKHS